MEVNNAITKKIIAVIVASLTYLSKMKLKPKNNSKAIVANIKNMGRPNAENSLIAFSKKKILYAPADKKTIPINNFSRVKLSNDMCFLFKIDIVILQKIELIKLSLQFCP